MAEIDIIVDTVSHRAIPVAIAASPGSLAIENVAGTLKQVDDQGTATNFGGGVGTVTSVAATAGGLLAVAGTPTVAPTVGLAAAAADTIIANVTGGSAVPTAASAAAVTAILAAATDSTAGTMSAADKTTIDGLAGVIATAGSNVTDLTVSGLAGDTDGDYDIECEILFNGNNQTFTIQPNGLATNQYGIYFIAGTGATVTTSLPVAAFTTTASSFTFRGILSSKSGRDRIWTSQAMGLSGSPAAVMIQSAQGIWEGTATAITSIGIHTNVTSGIATASWCRESKRAFTN